MIRISLIRQKGYLDVTASRSYAMVDCVKCVSGIRTAYTIPLHRLRNMTGISIEESVEIWEAYRNHDDEIKSYLALKYGKSNNGN